MRYIHLAEVVGKIGDKYIASRMVRSQLNEFFRAQLGDAISPGRLNEVGTVVSRGWDSQSLRIRVYVNQPI